MSIAQPASAFILYSQVRLPALRLEFPGETFGFYTQRLGQEFAALPALDVAHFVEAQKTAEETSGYAAADLLCISCNSRSNDVGGWRILNEAFALDFAGGMYSEEFVRSYNSTAEVPTTVEQAPQFFITTRLASRYGRCWFCPKC